LAFVRAPVIRGRSGRFCLAWLMASQPSVQAVISGFLARNESVGCAFYWQRLLSGVSPAADGTWNLCLALKHLSSDDSDLTVR